MRDARCSVVELDHYIILLCYKLKTIKIADIMFLYCTDDIDFEDVSYEFDNYRF